MGGELEEEEEREGNEEGGGDRGKGEAKPVKNMFLELNILLKA